VTPTSTRSLALVNLRGSGQIVVRDVSDINHPTTLANVATVPRPVFVSATELSFADEGVLFRAPLAGTPKAVVANPSEGVGQFAWSPDGRSVVYSTSTGLGTSAVRLQGSGVDLGLGTVAEVPAVGCEQIANCYGADTWDSSISRSPDGAYISLVTSIANVSVFRIWKADGTLIKSSDSNSPFMTVWSGSSLYFRDARGVEVWRDGVVSTFLPGVAWIRPKASPGGGQIVYETRDAERWSHTYVVDTSSVKVRDLAKAHAEPVFLTARYVWYQGERPCVAADACGTRVAGVANGTTYIYDLETGAESTSIITAVYDVWPHAS
jgi:Tol biopolymer transport system component